MQPTVSIIVPLFNAERHIEETVLSVLGQTYPFWELILVDDASTDHTEALVRGLAGRDQRLRYFRRHENSGGPPAPRNDGLKEARGTWVALLDQDDVWLPRKLEFQVRAMQAHPDLALLHTMVSIIHPRSPWASGNPIVAPRPWKAVLTRQDLEMGRCPICCTVMASTALVRDCGGFDASRDVARVDDFDLWLRLSRLGPIGFIPRVLAKYRVHAGNLSSDNREMQRRTTLVLKRYGVSWNKQPEQKLLWARILLGKARVLVFLVFQWVLDRTTGRHRIPLWMPNIRTWLHVPFKSAGQQGEI